MNNFKKLERTKKSTYVVEQILRSLENGVYSVGDKLPPETEIADETGVSRTSVREALSALQIAGIIESRPGDGTYVRETVNHSDITFQVKSILEESESPLEVWESRKYLEASIAELAVETCTSEDLEKLKKTIKMMEKALQDGDYNRYLEMNRGFHFQLAGVTGNSLLKRLLDSLLKLTNQLISHEISRKYVAKNQEKSVAKHKQILQAISDKNPNKARQVVKNHFEDLERFFSR